MMKKHIVLYGILIVAILYGNAFGATSVSKCCSGNSCSSVYIEGCKSCLSDLDCNSGTSGCTDCDSTDWAPTGTAGYESRINAICMILTGKCTKTPQYRCADSYYGTTTDGTSGCTPCPSSQAGGLGSGVTQGSCEPGSTSITACYIPYNEELCDNSGCYDTPEDCYYKN